MITIRAMNASDCKVVSELEKQVFSQPWSEQGFLDALARLENVFLVAEDKDGICGYIGMYQVFDEGEITNVAVSSEKRGQGIGSLLIEKALNIAKEQGVAQVMLEVRVSNQPAISLYEKSGFEHCGVRKGFYDFPKEDAYIMVYRYS